MAIQPGNWPVYKLKKRFIKIKFCLLFCVFFFCDLILQKSFLVESLLSLEKSLNPKCNSLPLRVKLNEQPSLVMENETRHDHAFRR